jgi:hypothetical protein
VLKQQRKKPVLFPYIGSKWRMVETIEDLMPNHVHFVELFNGSGAVTLGKPYSEVQSFNDKDQDIMLSGYESPLYTEMLSHWRHFKFKTAPIWGWAKGLRPEPKFSG